MLRIEAREDCIVFLCECGGCESPVATLRRDRSAGLRIESQHHGKKHTNVLAAEDLSWIKAYLSGPEVSIIREGLPLVSAARNIETLKC
jgi:hypothetical protein